MSLFLSPLCSALRRSPYAAAALVLALGSGFTPLARAQVRVAPVAHTASGGEEDYAFHAVTGPLSALARDDDQLRLSAWLESGFPHEIEERFVFRGGPAVPAGTFLMRYRLTALLYRDGGSDLGLSVPIPPPLPGRPGYLDASEERYLQRIGFEALIGNQPLPSLHDFPFFPTGPVVDLPDALPHGYPLDASLKWDTGSSVIPAESPEAIAWAERWDPSGASLHPGPLQAHGYAPGELIQNTPRGLEITFQFVVRGFVTAGNFDIAHRWDALQLEIDFQDGRGYLPWGRLEEYAPIERLEPRTNFLSRFRTISIPPAPILDGRLIDDRCIAICFNDSQPVTLNAPLRLVDEFDYDLLPYGIVDGRSLDALHFDATVYIHGAHDEGPNQPVPYPPTTDDAEIDQIELARIELYDWIHNTWTPLAPNYLGAGDISPSAPLRWRSQGAGSAAELWSRPATNGNLYPGGIRLSAFAPNGFPFQPGHVAPNGRLRLRALTQYRETTDWQRLYDTTFAWDSAELSANFGPGCALTAKTFPPTLRGLSAPRRGEDFALRAEELPAGGFALLLVGSSNQQWMGIPLPFLLSAGAANGCWLHVAPQVQLAAALAPTEHAVQWDFQPIPRDPSLSQAPMWAQVLGVDPTTGALSVSHGLGFRVQ